MLPDTIMTLRKKQINTFAPNMWANLEQLYVVAFTHKQTNLADIGLLHVNDEETASFLEELKITLGLDELMYLSTCNRVEFVFVTPNKVGHKFITTFLQHFSKIKHTEAELRLSECAEVYRGLNAVEHLFKVASSLDSMVVGEREIIGQVRKAYELSARYQLTGDLIRLAIRRTIETAKQIYTETNIASRPVSVVSLAYYELKKHHIKNDARFLIVGAGATNANMTRFLKKHGFKNFTVFNRTLAKAEELAKSLDGKAFPLKELAEYKEGFDVIITCTGADTPIFTKAIYNKLIGSDHHKKVIVDLAIPSDFPEQLADEFPVQLIGIETLKAVAEVNIASRKQELVKCNQLIMDNLNVFEEIYHERKVELAMRDIPQQVKQIKQLAMEEVFAKELASLDTDTKALLNKMLAYMEKKCISLPMKMAKEVLLDKQHKK